MLETPKPATTAYVTAGGVAVTRTDTPVEESVLTELVADLDNRRGAVLSSGVDYPGRYSRWHLGYVDPPIELVAYARRIEARALNERGIVLLPVVASAMAGTGEVVLDEKSRFAVDVPESAGSFTEEERSRQSTVFSALRAVVAAFASSVDQHLGLYGAYGYDLAFQFEPVRLRHDRTTDPHRDLVLHLPDQLVVVDRKRETSVRYAYDFEVDGRTTAGLARQTTPTPRAAARPVPPPPEPGRYAGIVRTARERFRRGDLFEVTPSHVLSGRCDSPAAFYERLRTQNPAPYEFFCNLGEGEYLVGASPEMYVRVSGDRVETCPIAGTIRRGRDALEDAGQIATLLNSTKDESELTMCTDVDRNDKARVCVPGSVRVIGRRQVELYSRLIHTVDHIEGRLRPGMDAFDAFLTHMWAVTVTGAPKQWAMQFIEDAESAPRRWYGGAVGFVGFDGSMNTGLTLRTAHVENSIASVRAGATLLYDSDPDEEERETLLKAQALLDTMSEPDPGPRSGACGDGPAAAVTDGGDAVGAGTRVLLVDHQDSFVHTLGDYFRQHGADVVTLRYGFPAEQLDSLAPDLVVLSPGPGRPADFDCTRLLAAVEARGLPVFGVCLGLQAMVEYAGGTLDLLPRPAHGKPGSVRVVTDGAGEGMLAGLGSSFTAGRYHSLYASPANVSGFEVVAVTDDPGGAQVAMAIADDVRRRWAVQFHPESILSATGRAGHQLVANVLRLARSSDRRPLGVGPA
ncbi:anthranilate synthase component I [Actinopolymorpha singaporensis]|uniref:Anthranilate synthase n=1 Tax=Actinopolymorpha singaporensis TaxID=117157 RepID=A0A1H1N0F1_9ACTN|nr:anthranilate synthase component I [Actinopolymorpha singaporensis]SDR92474.1 anthranilate synthase, component I [Actinopolymorpha singaporensis]